MTPKIKEAARDYANSIVTSDHHLRLSTALSFEAGAQYLQDELLKVKIQDAEMFYAYKEDFEHVLSKLDLGDSRDLRIIQYPLNTELPHLIQFIEALPVFFHLKQLANNNGIIAADLQIANALIQTQRDEIEKLKAQLEIAKNALTRIDSECSRHDTTATNIAMNALEELSQLKGASHV